MNQGVDSIVKIPCNINDTFFKYWFVFLKPFHHLTDREMDVIAVFVKIRYQLSKVITDATLLDKVVMNEDTKRKVREECNITLPHFQIVMSKLRKNKVIIDNKINPRYIPNIKEENGTFKMILLFDFK